METCIAGSGKCERGSLSAESEVFDLKSQCPPPVVGRGACQEGEGGR